MKSSDPNWKGCPPKYRSFAVVDDDDINRRQFVELIEGEYPKMEVRAHESLYECYRGWQRFDFVLLDVSTVAPNMMRDVAFAYGPIAKFCQEYPATQLIIHSGMSRNGVHEVIDDVRRVAPEAVVHYGGCGTWEPLKKLLKDLIKPEDFEWTKIKSKLKP